MSFPYRISRFFSLLILGVLLPFTWASAKIHIVAAENFYGEIAQQLGGERVNVTNILQNPEQDPHLFTASPAIAKAVAEAEIVVYNGANYDDWMLRLLSVPGKKDRSVLVVSVLTDVKSGDNPHIWYIPAVISSYARQLSRQFSLLEPAHQAEFAQRLAKFLTKQQGLEKEIQRLRLKTAGLPVTATEPVFNWMAEALAFKMRNLEFQWSVENEGSPSPSAVQSMMDDLTQHKVRALFYNIQVTSPLLEQIKTVAEQNHIPVIGITETQPSGTDYHQWMHQQLQSLDRAL